MKNERKRIDDIKNKLNLSLLVENKREEYFSMTLSTVMLKYRKSMKISVRIYLYS